MYYFAQSLSLFLFPAYLSPLLEKLSPFAEFTVRSQVLYYVKLNLRPRRNPRTGSHDIPADQLPLVINPVETKLTSFVSPNPALNFVTYVSPCPFHPMQILNGDGSRLESNAFFVPQWGGTRLLSIATNTYYLPCASLFDF